MKALFFNEHGAIDNLKFGDLPTPQISSDQVLVRVKACAINHLDLWVLRGWPQLKLNLPHIGGSDISGVIEQVGGKISNWKVGDRVSVNPGVVTGSDKWTKNGEESLSPSYKIIGESLPGGFAEFIAVPESNLFKLPDKIDFPEGSAPLLVGITSYRMLVKRAQLQAGETVLIIGAGGGVNSFSIQLAKHLGAKVIALTSSPEKAQKAKQLGAEEVGKK
jgi:NADPH:quinone reductase-like Zn-dependent oxidoreductase